MISLFFALVILSSGSYVTPGSVLHLYLTDPDLNTSYNGTDTLQTAGLFEFTINGIPIQGPSTMKETSVNSGVFIIDLDVPTVINGRSLGRGDVLLVKYHDQADSSGQPRTVTNSFPFSISLSQLSTSIKNVRIGEKFFVKLYDADWNLDSKRSDTVPLNLVEFRARGIRTNLANVVFDPSTQGLRETGPNTNLFVVKIEMPRQINGKLIKIGSLVELRFTDTSSPSLTSEILKTTLRVGYFK